MANRYGNYVTCSSLPQDPEAKAKMIRDMIIELIRTVPVNGTMDWNTLKIYVREPLKNIETPFDTLHEDGVKTRFTIIGYTIEEAKDGYP